MSQKFVQIMKKTIFHQILIVNANVKKSLFEKWFFLSLKIFKSHENVQISRNRARARPEQQQQQQPATLNSSPGASAGPGIQ